MVSQKQKRGGERAVEKTRNGKVQKRLFHFAWKSRTQRGIPTFPQPRLLLFRKHKTTTTGILIVVHRKEWLTPDTSPRVQKVLARRNVFVHGEWHLWIYCCNWKVFTKGKRTGDSSTKPRIRLAADVLNGQKLI